MRFPKLTILTAAAVCGIATPLPVATAVGPTVAVRYASPTGGGTICTLQAPCDIVEAVDQAPTGADIVVEPGQYGTAAAPLSTEITDASTGQLTVHGMAGKPMPVIRSSADYAIQMLTSRISDLHVIATGASGGVLGTSGDHLVVQSTGSTFGACLFSVMLSESLCVGAGDTTNGVSDRVPGSQVLAINNVTAIATGAHAEAFAVNETGAGLARVNVSSSIFTGTGYDVGVFAAAGGQAEINLSHSRYQTIAPAPLNGGTRSINDVGGNVNTAAKFLNPAAANYREQAGSPTIDAGTADPTFTTDVAAEPRSLGGGPDMGAYEHLLPPKVSHLKVSKRTAHRIVATVQVVPRGLTTRVRLIAKHGSHRSTSHAVIVSATTKRPTVSLVIRGLKRATRYTISATVATDGGHARSGETAARTRAH